MTRDEIIKETSLPDTGRITTYLDDLESCGFIRRYSQLGAKIKNTIFQLIDNFTLFHFKFLSNKAINDEGYWYPKSKILRYSTIGVAMPLSAYVCCTPT